MQVDSFLMTTSLLDLDIHALQLLNGKRNGFFFNEIHERNDFIKKVFVLLDQDELYILPF